MACGDVKIEVAAARRVLARGRAVAGVRFGGPVLPWQRGITMVLRKWDFLWVWLLLAVLTSLYVWKFYIVYIYAILVASVASLAWVVPMRGVANTAHGWILLYGSLIAFTCWPVSYDSSLPVFLVLLLVVAFFTCPPHSDFTGLQSFFRRESAGRPFTILPMDSVPADVVAAVMADPAVRSRYSVMGASAAAIIAYGFMVDGERCLRCMGETVWRASSGARVDGDKDLFYALLALSWRYEGAFALQCYSAALGLDCADLSACGCAQDPRVLDVTISTEEEFVTCPEFGGQTSGTIPGGGGGGVGGEESTQRVGDGVSLAGVPAKVKSGKVRCSRCGFMVVAEGHAERCRLPVDGQLRDMMRKRAWLGDTAHAADVRQYLVCQHMPVTALEGAAQGYTCAAAQAAWFGKHRGGVEWSTLGESERQLSQAFEANYSGEFRRLYLAEQFPGFDFTTSFSEFAAAYTVAL